MKTYAITTFGCQMNHSDSERIAAICELMGYTKAKDENNADLYVINTCSVRQKAEDRVLGMGKKFYKLKLKNENLKIVLTGCMAKRDLRQGSKKSIEYEEKYIAKLHKQMPWVDVVVGINDIHKLPNILGEKANVTFDEYFAVKPRYNSNFQAFIPISTGCNKFCTFCIVPFTRGEEVYRPFQQIYTEIKDLISIGYKEITLLGQNVNSWKSDMSGHLRIPIPRYRKTEHIKSGYIDFADLMEAISQIEGDFWLRFTSSHPYDINPRLIDVIAENKNIAKQIHFALQAGSDSVLKRMNRHYTIAEFREKVDLIRKKIPGVAITTDVIVGFCGETDLEFEETLKVCEELKFDQIYISEYSQRQGTIASKFYKDDVPKEVKATRKAKLDEVLKRGVLENNKKLIGSEQRALVCKTDYGKTNGLLAKTTQGKDVLVNILKDTQTPKLGEFINVKITGAREFILEGEVINI